MFEMKKFDGQFIQKISELFLIILQKTLESFKKHSRKSNSF